MKGTSNHEGDIEEGVDGVSQGVEEGARSSDVVDESTDRHDLTLIAGLLPFTENRGDEGSSKVTIHHLREEVDVGDEGAHEDNGHVRGVEETNGVGGVRCRLVVRQLESHFEAFEVDDHKENEHCSHDVAQVGQTFSEESIVNGTEFVFSEENSVEKFNKGSLILLNVSLSSFVLEGEGREAVPGDGFGHIDGNEDAGG